MARGPSSTLVPAASAAEPGDVTALDPFTALIRAAVRAEFDALRAELLAERLDPVPAREPGSDRLTLAEAAELLRCHPRTVRRLIATGRLRALRLSLRGSSKVLVARAEAERFLREGAP